MIKNSGELIALAQPLVFIDDLIHLLVEFGGGKYQQYKWLKWHNTVVSYLVALCRASSRNSPIGLAIVWRSRPFYALTIVLAALAV